jgi:hypothetical protein
MGTSIRDIERLYMTADIPAVEQLEEADVRRGKVDCRAGLGRGGGGLGGRVWSELSVLSETGGNMISIGSGANRA